MAAGPRYASRSPRRARANHRRRNETGRSSRCPRRARRTRGRCEAPHTPNYPSRKEEDHAEPFHRKPNDDEAKTARLAKRTHYTAGRLRIIAAVLTVGHAAPRGCQTKEARAPLFAPMGNGPRTESREHALTRRQKQLRNQILTSGAITSKKGFALTKPGRRQTQAPPPRQPPARGVHSQCARPRSRPTARRARTWRESPTPQRTRRSRTTSRLPPCASAGWRESPPPSPRRTCRRQHLVRTR